MSEQAIVGAILGTAVGDALGLAYEGLSPRRGRRLFGAPDGYHFLPGRGMVSDDTEHTCMVAQALIASAGDPGRFARDLGRRMRWWLLSLPLGLGRATLKACVRLWLGWPPDRSGVYSAGNGAAMRVAVLGAAVEEEGSMKELVRVCARITHTDERAEAGAQAVALAARLARTGERVEAGAYLEALRAWLAGSGGDVLAGVALAVKSVDAGEATEMFAQGQGWARGVSGYVLHTIPVAIHAWLEHQGDYRGGVRAAVACGGDADTTAAIAGGVLGTAVGKGGIPGEWLARLWEWPRTVRWMEGLGARVAEVMRTKTPGRAPRLPVVGLVARNVLFDALVVGHVLRRGLPPY